MLPAFGLVYLIAGPPKLGRRVWHAILIGLVDDRGRRVVGRDRRTLWPASSRPYIGGSQNNSFFNVLFGYNGFGRLTGNETGSVGGARRHRRSVGPDRLTRLFNSQFGGQASWLLPAALILLVGGARVDGYAGPRTDRTRAALMLWGGWLVVTGLAISLGKGIIHEYYTVALAPAIGAVVGIGGAFMWRHREHAGAARAVARPRRGGATAIWACDRCSTARPTGHPWLHDARAHRRRDRRGGRAARARPSTAGSPLAVVGRRDRGRSRGAHRVHPLHRAQSAHGRDPDRGPGGRGARGFGPGGGGSAGSPAAAPSRVAAQRQRRPAARTARPGGGVGPVTRGGGGIGGLLNGTHGRRRARAVPPGRQRRLPLGRRRGRRQQRGELPARLG